MDRCIVLILVSNSQRRSLVYSLMRSGSFPGMNSPPDVSCGIRNLNSNMDG
uniref:Uncharacterized protein n=1 Tax=Lepeophtheirus salmonis TaxID=72036 RepID=A0A0K2T7I9_LEPSM